jgi:biotin-(acetyl-CoA carboxylase) ligase
LAEAAVSASELLSFPPLLSGHSVAPQESAFETAAAAAAAGRAGAGDLFWSEAVDRFDLAVVLEPEVETRRAVQAHFALMVAFGDALGTLAPPETAVHYRWPSAVLVNGAVAGRVRLGLPADAVEDAVPDWLVSGIEIAILSTEAPGEPGLDPDRTSLWEEGCGDLGRTQLVESVSRHLLSWIDSWEADGFRPVHQAWLARAERRDTEIGVEWGGRLRKGRFLGIDEAGNLILQTSDGTEALSIAAVVERIENSR